MHPAIASKVSFRGPLSLTADAEKILRPICYDHWSHFLNGLQSRKFQLWLVDESSWLVTEKQNDCIFVWLYAGKNSVSMIAALKTIALKNGLHRIEYYSKHRGMWRLLRFFQPKIVNVDSYGNQLFRIVVTA